jgi:hypothetical protein
VLTFTITPLSGGMLLRFAKRAVQAFTCRLPFSGGESLVRSLRTSSLLSSSSSAPAFTFPLRCFSTEKPAAADAANAAGERMTVVSCACVRAFFIVMLSFLPWYHFRRRRLLDVVRICSPSVSAEPAKKRLTAKEQKAAEDDAARKAEEAKKAEAAAERDRLSSELNAVPNMAQRLSSHPHVYTNKSKIRDHTEADIGR